jgi:hypothetical protein
MATIARDSDDDEERHPLLVCTLVTQAFAALDLDTSNEEGLVQKPTRGPMHKPKGRVE